MEHAIIIALLIFLIVLVICYMGSCRGAENLTPSNTRFTILGNLAGLYTVQARFPDSVVANRLSTVQVVPQRPVNPDYLTLIFGYHNGKTESVRTNASVGLLYSYYTSINNVGYLNVPEYLWYSIDIGSGNIQAKTVVTENGQNTLKVMEYFITSRVPRTA